MKNNKTANKDYRIDDFLDAAKEHAHGIELLRFMESRKIRYQSDTPGKNREYQIKAIREIVKHIIKEDGKIVAATGLGKSRILAKASETLVKKKAFDQKCILFISHNRDILANFMKEFSDLSQVEYFGNPNSCAKYFLATIQELYGLLKRDKKAFNKLYDKFGLVIPDELHRFPDTDVTAWSNVIKSFQKNKLRILGATGTPYRTDGQLLVCEKTIYEYLIKEAVQDRRLSEVYAWIVQTHVKPIGATFVGENLDLKFWHADRKERYRVIEETLYTVNLERKRTCQTVIFVRRIAEAKELTKFLQKKGRIGSVDYVVGKNKSQNRDEVYYDKFRNRKLNVLVNVNVVTEGVDLDVCDVVCMARSTRSKGLYLQMLGRGTRIMGVKGKDNLLVIDFVDNIEQNHFREVVTAKSLRDEEEGKEKFGSGFVFMQDDLPDENKYKICNTEYEKKDLYKRNTFASKEECIRIFNSLEFIVDKNGKVDAKATAKKYLESVA